MYKKLAAKAAALGVLGAGLLGLSPATASADDTFLICPDGRSGIATAVTSCDFAQNVNRAYYSQAGSLVSAYSPATKNWYTMQCQSGFTANLNNNTTVTNAIRCAGGNNAVVVLLGK